MDNEKKLRLTKGTVKFAVGMSVGFVVTRAIKTYVPVDNNLQKAEVYIASKVIAGMVAKKSVAYADAKFDEAVEQLKSIQTQLEEQA